MDDKLTPRQNELISETLCAIAAARVGHESTPEVLRTIRRALVSELEAVTRETRTNGYCAPSISG